MKVYIVLKIICVYTDVRVSNIECNNYQLFIAIPNNILWLYDL